MGKGQVIGKRIIHTVTGGAGDLHVAAEMIFKKQFFAKSSGLRIV